MPKVVYAATVTVSGAVWDKLDEQELDNAVTFFEQSMADAVREMADALELMDGDFHLED